MATKDEPPTPPTLTEEELKLISMIRDMGLKPKIDTSEDMLAIASALHDGKAAMKGKDPPAKDPFPNFHYPKVSAFYGEPGKGEVTWESFKFEVGALKEGKPYSKEQILYGVRRAIKGQASEKIRQLGPDATLDEIHSKLESEYGTIESIETAMQKFYTCKQQPGESVECFASRLEDFFFRLVDLGAISRSETHTLKKMLHTGLRSDLKHMSAYQRDTIHENEAFKVELRRIEADLKKDPEPKPCKPVTSCTDKTEQTEITKLLKQLNERI